MTKPDLSAPTHKKSSALITTLLSAALLISAFSQPALSAEDKEVAVYSARKEALIKPILDTFSKETGIKVKLITGKADALLTRLKREGKATRADLFITTDAGRLQRAKEAGVFQTIDNEVLNTRIAETFRDSDQQWFGLSQRARPIFYVKDRVKPEELSSYEALTDAKWNKRICIRSSGNIYNQSLVASMLMARGEEATTDWVKAFVANFARKPAGGDTDQLKAAAAGVCDIAIANTYYFGRLQNSDKPELAAVADKLGLFWPNQDDRGVHMNVSGAGVIKHSKHRDSAIKLLEFLVSEQAQQWYAEVDNEFPVVTDAVVSDKLKSWGEFKADSVNLSKLGEMNRQAVKIMDRGGWK